MKKRNLVASLVFASLPVVGSYAAEEEAGLNYVLRAGMTYSDNIMRVPSPFEEDSSAFAVGAELHGARPTGRLRYETGLDILHYQYLNGDVDSATFGRGLLKGSYDFFPDHFRWNASINFDQMRGDLLQPIAPGNVENVITLSTGPTLRGELFGAVDTLLDAHYDRAYYSGDTVDNQTVGGRLELGRRTGPRTRYGLGGSLDDVSYLGSALSSALDFQRREAFLYGESSGVRTELTAELGYSEADGDGFDSDGPVARIRLTRQMSSALSAYVGYRHEYPTSQPGATASDPTVSGGGIVNTSQVTSAPREDWRGELGFRYQRTRSEAELGYYHLDEKSLIELLGDHTYDELRVRVTRHFSAYSQGSLYAAYSREDFSAFAEKFNDLLTGFEYGHDFSPTLGFDVRIEYRDRNSDGSTSSYNELSGGVFLRYNGKLTGRNPTSSPANQGP